MSSSEMSELPAEEDRKLFLGCLAEVLASSYDYDVTEIKEASVLNSGIKNEESSSDEESTKLSHTSNDENTPSFLTNA
eukprot:CAMPEP_0194340852 /NCGR_PEP_ID=MMETSP0171-20130528/87789_1 /TAXON_ID=218684 /ORGANISM="Corethron pennatum, Strain L29A3" /LENGTH=77 /DNA_ID=CAMNT_0039105961 /DNA_START=11 /DNA_END=240 /DNA_ORIENTATION=+